MARGPLLSNKPRLIPMSTNGMTTRELERLSLVPSCRHKIPLSTAWARCGQHHSQSLKPALRAALHSMLDRSPPALRCRRFPSQQLTRPRRCPHHRRRRRRRPHDRRRSHQLKPALRAPLRNLLGRSPPAVRHRVEASSASSAAQHASEQGGAAQHTSSFTGGAAQHASKQRGAAQHASKQSSSTRP